MFVFVSVSTDNTKTRELVSSRFTFVWSLFQHLLSVYIVEPIYLLYRLSSWKQSSIPHQVNLKIFKTKRSYTDYYCILIDTGLQQYIPVHYRSILFQPPTPVLNCVSYFSFSLSHTTLFERTTSSNNSMEIHQSETIIRDSKDLPRITERLLTWVVSSSKS